MAVTEDEVLDLAVAGEISNAQAKQVIDAIRAGQQITRNEEGDFRRVETTGARFEQIPKPSGFFGALMSGAETGFKEIGAGVLETAGRAGELLGVEGGAELQAGTARALAPVHEEFEARTADFPITGEVGRVAGQVAAFPAGGVTKTGAAVAGAAAGALQPTGEPGKEGDIQRALNTVIGGVAGPVFQVAIPAAIKLIQKGANKAFAVSSQLFKAATKKTPPPGAFDEAGNPTQAFVKAMNDAGISTEELDAAMNLVEAPNAGQVAEALSGSFEQAAAQGLDPAAAARLAEFDALAVPATTGQVARDFATAQAEDVARGTTGPGGAEAREFFRAQQAALVEATRKFSKSIGAAEGATTQERGAAIKATLDAVKNENKAEVTALYETAKRLAGDETPVPGRDLEDVFFTAIDELAVDDKVIRPLESALARFGVFEGEVVKKGTHSVLTRADGSTVRFKGDQVPLTLKNAEQLRQRFNAVFTSDQSGIVGALKNQLDTLVNGTLDAATEGAPGAQKAITAARAAFQDFSKTFKSADIVGKLLGVGKDRATPLIDDSVVVDKILKSQNKVENIQRVKRALGKSNKSEAQVAIRELQRGFVDDIFKKAISDTPDGVVISGAKLNSAMERIGPDAMKELFTPELIASLSRLRRVVGNATIPIPRTTNVSGSGDRVLNGIIAISNATEGVPGTGGFTRFGLAAIKRSIDKTKADEAEAAILAGIREARVAEKVTPKLVRDESSLARFLSLYAPRIARQATVAESENIEQAVE